MKSRSIILLSTLFLVCASQANAIVDTQTKQPPVVGDAITVKLADASQTQTMKLVCGDDIYQPIQAPSDRLAKFEEVSSGHCTLHFKGGISAKFTPAHPEDSYTCRIIGQTAICKEM